MYNVAATPCSPLIDYDEICTHRAPSIRPRLVGIRAQIADSYQVYESTVEHLRDLSPSPFSTQDQEMLLNNYRHLDKSASCEHIRNEILASTKQSRCPYCRLNEVSTLDHIVEKRAHPEYSVLRDNLAPACSDCNTKKEHNRTKGMNRQILHLYRQGFPKNEFLVATPEFEADAVNFRFELKRPASVSSTTWWDAIEWHFERLELARRYRARSVMEMQDRRLNLIEMRAFGPKIVRDFLLWEARSIAYNWGEQDWQHALLIGAASSPDFCDWGVNLL